MTISLKSTIIFSGTLAALLNVWQFAATYQQKEDAFAPKWATAAVTSASPMPQAAQAKPRATLASDSTSSPPPLSYTPPAQPAPAAPTIEAPLPFGSSVISSQLDQAGLSAQFAGLYENVAAATGTPWQLLAAVHKAETNQAGDTDRSSGAGATGPMQFMPATFDAYAAPGHDDITSVNDAVLAAGRYLAANGASSENYENAVYHYNHSWSYVDRVMAIAGQLGL